MFLLLALAAAAATILAYALAGAAIYGLFLAVVAVFRFALWVITRPIVWPIMAIRRLVSGGPNGRSAAHMPATTAQANIAQDIHHRAERLSRLKALLDNGALSEAEYDRMKAEVLS